MCACVGAARGGRVHAKTRARARARLGRGHGERRRHALGGYGEACDCGVAAQRVACVNQRAEQRHEHKHELEAIHGGYGIGGLGKLTTATELNWRECWGGAGLHRGGAAGVEHGRG